MSKGLIHRLWLPASPMSLVRDPATWPNQSIPLKFWCSWFNIIKSIPPPPPPTPNILILSQPDIGGGGGGYLQTIEVIGSEGFNSLYTVQRT